MSNLEIVKNLGVRQNVTLNVIDEPTGKIVQSHSGHNMATNSLIFGIARYLVGMGVLGQGESTLTSYIPQYISLGTMGLNSAVAGSDGLPQITLSTYLEQYPAYGSDGYDPNKINNRGVMGLGKPFTSYSNNKTYKVGDKTTYNGKEYTCKKDQDIPGEFPVKKDIYWKNETSLPVGRELIRQIRSPITFRDIEDEMHSELPGTVDAIFSGMVSTGELATFREGRDYIFITEAGLWSKRTWSNSGENGLLAGYRLVPKNTSDHSNLTKVKQSILRVGINQVVQVIWKIQIGSLPDLLADL